MANIVETFTGTNGTLPSGWTATGSGTATIQSNAFQIVSPATGTYVTERASRTGLANGDLVVDVLVSTLTEHYPEIVVRSSSATAYANGYALNLLPADSVIEVSELTAGSRTVLGSNAAFTFTAGNTYRVRFQWSGSALRAKIWLASGSEPGSWMIDTTDASVTAAGTLHLCCTSGGTAGARTTTFDSLTVTDLDVPPTADVAATSTVAVAATARVLAAAAPTITAGAVATAGVPASVAASTTASAVVSAQTGANVAASTSAGVSATASAPTAAAARNTTSSAIATASASSPAAAALGITAAGTATASTGLVALPVVSASAVATANTSSPAAVARSISPVVTATASAPNGSAACVTTASATVTAASSSPTGATRVATAATVATANVSSPGSAVALTAAVVSASARAPSPITGYRTVIRPQIPTEDTPIRLVLDAVDTLNGNYAPNAGRSVLIFRNTGPAAVSALLQFAPQPDPDDDPDMPGHETVAIPNGGVEVWTSTLPADLFCQPNGQLVIDFTSAVGVSVAAVEVYPRW